MTDQDYNEYLSIVKMAVLLDSKEMLEGIYKRILYEEGGDKEIIRRLDTYNYRWSGMLDFNYL